MSVGSTMSGGSNTAWMRWVLRVAGVYNVAWGALVVLWPTAIFTWLGVAPEQMPNGVGLAIWQCVGMIVGVYGVGYWVAGSDPLRHWPIVLVGLLGKIFGPIGFIDAALVRGVFPVQFGWTIVTNDLIWWVPFALILWAAWKTRGGQWTLAR
jgi:small multidrug resistance pump